MIQDGEPRPCQSKSLQSYRRPLRLSGVLRLWLQLRSHRRRHRAAIVVQLLRYGFWVGLCGVNHRRFKWIVLRWRLLRMFDRQLAIRYPGQTSRNSADCLSDHCCHRHSDWLGPYCHVHCWPSAGWHRCRHDQFYRSHVHFRDCSR